MAPPLPCLTRSQELLSDFLVLKQHLQPELVGVNSLYLYALPSERLMEHYEKMGFTRLPSDQEKFVQDHVKPVYDVDCIFMYQVLSLDNDSFS